jgi:hypothetical protein
VVVSVVVAAAALAGTGPTDQVREPIRVVSNTHEVRFPREVLFRLEAEAESPITEIRLYYQLARRPVSVYGYPEFAPSTSVTAEFSVKTDGSSYIPSGVVIAYHYEIRDAGGNRLESERYSLEYLDPGHTWERLDLGNLQVLWHDVPEDRVRDVVADVEARLREVKGVVGLAQTPPMKAVLVNSTREARRSLPPVSEAASREHVYGGFAFGEYDLFVLQGLSADAILHEVTHLLVGEALSSPLARLPAWLNEGLAMYFEAGSHRRQAAVERAARSGSLQKLSAMGNQPGTPEAVSLFYSQAWSIVSYMFQAHGTERMTALLSAVGAGEQFDAALTSVYGFSLSELETDWRSTLMAETTVAARPDLGTIGTSTLMTGAILLAIVASAVRWYQERARRLEPTGEDE